MPRADLTAKFCRDITPPAKGRETWTDNKLAGFCLTVSASGAKVFYRVGRHSGGVTRTRIDSYPKITAEAARKLCTEKNGDIAKGDHPRARKAKGKALGDVWEWYWVNACDGVLKSSRHYWNTWKRVFPAWAKLPLSAIDRPMVIELVTSLKDRPGAVNMALTVLRALFKCAIDNDWHSGKNPTTGVSKAFIASRERFLLPSEVSAFFAGIATLPEDRRDMAIISLYTGARRDNVNCMRWDEIDRDAAAWSVPSNKSKGKSHMRIVLTQEVIEILSRRYFNRKSDIWVFPSKASKTGHVVDWRKAWEKMLKTAGIENLHLHDLRRTLGSWQALSGVSLQVIGASLGHKAGSTATGVYARLQDSTVRDSVQNAVIAIQKTVLENNSKESSE